MPHGKGVCRCPTHQQRAKPYRQTFLDFYGPGPYICPWCSQTVPFEKCDVDHIDENHDNDDPLNLQAMHHACHAAKSRSVNWADPEYRKKMEAVLKAINENPLVRFERSVRATQQHAEGALGRRA